MSSDQVKNYGVFDQTEICKCIIGVRHYFVNKGPSSQGYDFSSGHIWMSELDYNES